jgi:hypothetical protein
MNIRPISLGLTLVLIGLGTADAQTPKQPTPPPSPAVVTTEHNTALSGGSAGSLGQHPARRPRTRLSAAEKAARAASQNKSPAAAAGAGGQ